MKLQVKAQLARQRNLKGARLKENEPEGAMITALHLALYGIRNHWSRNKQNKYKRSSILGTIPAS